MPDETVSPRHPSDPDATELLERRLSESVTERAEKALIKRFTWIGGIILVVLGYFGYDLTQDVRRQAIQAAKDIASQVVKEEVTPVLTDARVRLNEARIQMELNKGRLGQVDETLSRHQVKAESASQQASAIAERVKSNLKDINTEVDELKRKVDETRRTAEDQLKTLRDSVRDSGTLMGLNDNLATLTKQVKALDEVMQALVTRGETDTVAIPPASVKQSLEEIVDATKQRGEQYREPDRRNLVFFQFARLPLEQAKAIAAALRNLGYVVPGQEPQETIAANLQQVRYFYDEDKDAAERLATQTSRVWAELGYGQIVVKAQSFTAYKGVKPRVGVLELWLGVKPT